MSVMELVMLLLKVTLFAAIGRLLLIVLAQRTAALRFAVAMLALSGTLLLPLVAIMPARIPIPLLRAAGTTVAETAVDAPQQPLPVRAETHARPLPPPRTSWREWALLVYLAIVALMLGRLLLGVLTLKKVIREARPAADDVSRIAGDAAPQLLVSHSVAVPLIWGLRQPLLILPASALLWSEERLRAVLLHEIAHWRRRDVLSLLVMRVATAVYWFHPIVWTLAGVARRECERACDDAVLSAGMPASDYAAHLTAIARNLGREEPFGAVTVAMSRPSELEGRVAAILRSNARRAVVSRRLYATLAAGTLAIAIPLGASHLVGHATGAKPVPAPAAAPSPAVVDSADIEQMYQEGKQSVRDGRLDDAIAQFTNVVRANPSHSSARYNLACAYALRGERQLALSALRDAVLYGYGDAGHMREDDDLASLRGRALDDLADLAENLVISDREGSWAAAIPRYERFANAHPDIMRAWFNLGFVLVGAHEDRRAIEVYERVVRAGYRPGTSMYNLACAHAHLNEREAALTLLHRAQDAGFDVASRVSSDPDLENLRDDPWLASIAATKQHKSEKFKGGK